MRTIRLAWGAIQPEGDAKLNPPRAQLLRGAVNSFPRPECGFFPFNLEVAQIFRG